MTNWIYEINERANIYNPVIMVLANKCDSLDSINQESVLILEREIEEKYPNVMYREISVLFNIDVQSCMSELAGHMQNYRQNYAQ